MGDPDVLARWQDDLYPAVAGLQDRLAAEDDIDLDYSADSLRAVEDLVLESYDNAVDVLDGLQRPVVTALIGYIGLTLVHRTMATWSWDGRPGFAERARPTVTDPALLSKITVDRWELDGYPDSAAGIPILLPRAGLSAEPVSPLHLLLTVVQQRRPAGQGALSQVFAAWSRDLPQPAEGRTNAVVGVDVFDAPPPTHELDTWLAQRQAGFAAWSDRHPGNWDFGAASVDALTELVLARTPTEADINDPANQEFVDTASWYLGETLRQAAPSRWVFRDYAGQVRVGLANEGDPYVVCYQLQTADDTRLVTPFYLLRFSVRTGEPKARSYFDSWVQLYGNAAG